MAKFKLEKSKKLGIYKIYHFASSDNRGDLIKDYSYNDFLELGIDFKIKENFYTVSKKGVIRANHFQIKVPQAKIIRVIKGKIYDVVVDLRKNSETYKHYEVFEMDENTDFEILIPEGFSHGYLVLEDSIVSYKTNAPFVAEYDSGIKWNDEILSIQWPTNKVKNIILSDKDENLMSFLEFDKVNNFKK